MDNNHVKILQDSFNAIANTLEDTEIEFWYARELQSLLGYKKWDKFLNVIKKQR